MPFSIVAAAIGLVCLLIFLEEQFGKSGILRRLECLTFDWRVRQAAQRPQIAATNLGFVFISDDSIEALNNGTLEFRVGLYWPRHVYGRLVRELREQGASTVGFDILFPDPRLDHGTNNVPGAVSSDAFFAKELNRAGNIVLAADKGVIPYEGFRTNAWMIGDISASKEADGVLRRARAFETYYVWHSLIRKAAARYGFDLRQPTLERTRISFPITGGFHQRVFKLDEEGNFDAAELLEEMMGEKIKGVVRPFQKPCQIIRVWDMGLAVAARQLGLDLSRAVVIPRKQIVLEGPGITRTIPIDEEGRFIIDWSITAFDRRLTRESIESLLLQAQNRQSGDPTPSTNRWKDKLVFVGSIASGGNDLTDLGATPLEKETYLTSRFWNTANSLLTGRFIRQMGIRGEMLLIIMLGIVAGAVTRWSRPGWAVIGVFAAGGLYVLIANQLYVANRIWLPVVSPMAALVLSHFGLVAHRAFAEHYERRRIKSVFARIVSPAIVNELLKAEQLSLVGANRKVTISFADVRGFTQLADRSQSKARQEMRERKLSERAAEAYFDARSRELLETVNLYLGLMADIVKKHDGTLDKYIGDCVMAFWGAPAANEKHARACVRAAIEAQQSIAALNVRRAAENAVREQQNRERLQRGEEPLPLLELLVVGTGINTGMVTVGLMGSDAHVYNYTVFGRDVNVASRLESYAGGGRIIIGEATYLELLQDDPELASACKELEPVTARGISLPIKVFEVPWHSGSHKFDDSFGDEHSVPPRSAERPVRATGKHGL